MRRCETRIRQVKDTANLARAAGDEPLRRQCQQRILALNGYYEQMSDQAGLGPAFERTYVAGFGDAKLTGGAKDGTINLQGDERMAGIHSPIEQRNTGKGSPNAMEHFGRPLNNRQQRLDDALQEYNTRVTVPKKNVSLKDIAALTAKTNVEYALFTRKGKRMVIRGAIDHVQITPELASEMAAQGWRWSGHTHPGTDASLFKLFCKARLRAVIE